MRGSVKLSEPKILEREKVNVDFRERSHACSLEPAAQERHRNEREAALLWMRSLGNQSEVT